MQKKIEIIYTVEGFEDKKGYGTMEINSSIGVDQSEECGMLLSGYIQSANNFINNHPPECTGCDAYTVNLRILEGIEGVYKLMENK